jgi:adenylate kinase
MMPDKSLLVHVGGSRGAGKSSVLSLMTQTVTVGLPLVVIPASAFVMELGRERYARGWDELTVAEKEEMREAFVEHLKQFCQGICVLDSHYVDLLPGGKVRPIIPAALYPLIGCHVVIDCSVEVLLARRKSDPVKKRPLNRRHIERERRGEISVAQRIAKEMETPCHIVPNEQDTQYAAECLGGIIKAQWRHVSTSSPPILPK